jgi:D-beta-D-heptose 7-phosphate kinase/D-beta-D-heptose 1-phosphate adenosyltransferase
MNLGRVIMNEKETYKSIEKYLKYEISQCRVIVLGDVMLDGYLYGDVSRISPEAPVPVSHITKRKETLGGAANVAHNLAKLGCQTDIVGVIGDDGYAKKLHSLLRNLQINDAGLIVGRNKTTSKIRVISGHQQMVRLDFEETTPVESSVQVCIKQYIQKQLNKGAEALIISDYDKGVCTIQMCQDIISLAHEQGMVVFVDPKGSKWDKYSGADYITPNVKELGEAMGHIIKNETAILQPAAELVRQTYHIKNVLVTRSEKGISLFSDNEPLHIPTVAQDVFDVSGAGDTVIAAFTAAVAGRMNLYDAAYMANFAAGIGVGKVGTYAVSREEILDQL